MKDVAPAGGAEPVPCRSTPLAVATPLPPIRPIVMPVSGALTPFVSGLAAVEVDPIGPMTLSVAPHESLVLTVQIGRASHCIEQKGALGENTHITGIRHWTGSFRPAGDCYTLFALLTPLGAVQLLDSQPMSGVPRIRARVADLLDAHLTSAIESEVALADTLADKLRRFASWLEHRALMPRRHSRAALRAARAAMHVRADPSIAIEALAAQECVSRRQLERDFAHWVGTSPRHLSQVARVQTVSRLARRHGGSLAGIAGAAGFADQAHMTRVVRQLTGLTPLRFLQSCATPLSRAFHLASGGGTIYL